MSNVNILKLGKFAVRNVIGRDNEDVDYVVNTLLSYWDVIEKDDQKDIVKTIQMALNRDNYQYRVSTVNEVDKWKTILKKAGM